MINNYLNQRFSDQLNRKDYKPLTITPLVTMSAGTVERAMRVLAKMPLSAILENRITTDKNLGRPFEAASKYVIKGTARNMPEHMKLMTTAINEVIKDFGINEEDGSPGRVG
jgi:hypothetical protein